MPAEPPDPYAIIAAQQETIAKLTDTVEKLRGEIADLKHLLFGQKSERRREGKMPSIERSLREREGNDPAREVERRLATKKKRAKSAAKKKELPTVDVVHDVEQCPECEGGDLEDLKSPEESYEIELVPAHLVRIRHVRQKKKCRSCRKIITAPAPVRVTEGCQWGPRLHAHAVTAKCGDAIPFYRLAKRFQRDGMPVERSTLNRVFHRSAELLRPVANRILELVSQQERVNADETPIRVQAPEKCRRGYVWTFLSGKLIGYVFSPSRSGETPSRILGGTNGTLQVDNYTGYNAVTTPDARERVGCIGHVRRKFFRALESAPDEADTALAHILSLYEVEYEAARRGILGTSKHLALRRSLTKERLDAFGDWMREKQPHHLPESPMGKALRYGLATLPSLTAVLRDAKVRLDNNLAENALRIIALGRKNFLFVGDDVAGENLAVLQTVVATCIANDVNSEEYIADVLLRLDDTRSSDIDSLLPMNWQPREDSS